MLESLVELIVVVFAVGMAAWIIIVSTRLFIRRLRAGEPKFKSSREWIKNLIEAVIGLG